MIIWRHVFELLVNPYFICMFALGVASWFLLRRTHLRLVRVLVPLVFLGLYLISTSWLPVFLSQKLENQYPVVNQVDPSVHWVVVLGGGEGIHKGIPANSLLTSASLKRLVEGVRLFKALPDAQLLLSGGGYNQNIPEAVQMARTAQIFAVPEQKIVLETKSDNTVDQAQVLKSFVHDQAFYLVTSAVHMPRAMALCQHQGLHPIAAPTDFTFLADGESWDRESIPNAFDMEHLSIVLHELLGRLYASISGQE